LIREGERRLVKEQTSEGRHNEKEERSRLEREAIGGRLKAVETANVSISEEAGRKEAREVGMSRSRVRVRGS
jgi:hypothetical protein